MSEGIVNTYGSVTIIHHSTANVYMILVKEKDNQEDGTQKDAIEKMWLDSYQFSDLKEVIKQIQ